MAEANYSDEKKVTERSRLMGKFFERSPLKVRGMLKDLFERRPKVSFAMTPESRPGKPLAKTNGGGGSILKKNPRKHLLGTTYSLLFLKKNPG